MTQIPAQYNDATDGAADDLTGPSGGSTDPSSPASADASTESATSSRDSSPPLEMNEFNYYATPSSRRRSRMQTAPEVAGPQRRADDPGNSRSRFIQRWANLGMRSKLTLLLMIAAAVPTVGLAQGLITVNKGKAFQDAKAQVAQDAKVFRDAHVLWYETDGAARAKRIAELVELAKVDLNQPKSVAPRRIELQNYVTLEDGLDPSVSHNFQMLLDAQGRSVVQDIRVLNAPQGIPANEQEAKQAVYGRVTAPVGINLAQLPIVQTVLASGEAAAGIDIMDAATVKALKLNLQASIVTDSDVLEGGKAAMASLAVQPIKRGDRVVGTAIVGTIYNRHQTLPDVYKTRHSTSAAAVFAENVTIATTEAVDGTNTRQVGEKAPPDIARQVLEQKQPALDITRINGHRYLGYYLPIFREANPSDSAKPIGMAYVGQSLEALDKQFLTQQATTYGLGLAVLGLAGLLAAPAASSITEPLRKLSGFMNRISRGDRRLRLTDIYRTDEVGTLTTSLNKMVASLETNEIQLQQQLTRNQILSKIANLRSVNSHDMAEGLQDALEDARQFLSSDRLVIYRCGSTSADSRVMYEAKATGIASAVELNVSDRCIPESTLAAYRNGEYKSNPDVHNAGFGPEHIELLESLSVKASLIIPIYSNQELYGLLVSHDCKGSRNWAESDITIMQSIAAQVAVTMGYVTLLEQQQQSEQQIRTDKELFQRRALELLQEVDPVSQGDLTVRARVTEDEIGTIADSYNSTVESLRKIVAQVQTVSGQVTGTAENNDAAVQKLAFEALSQSERVTDSLEKIQAMTATVNALTEQAQAAQQAVVATTKTVETGDRKMTLAVEGMVTIRETVAETTRKMEDLEEASQRISQVIRLISGFAAQTHMLAMKASIEAARAGERGEGFAVIADEVRTLAGRSAQATADVEAIINSIQIATQDALAAMLTENKQVEREMELVDDTRTSLNQITAASAQVNQLVVAIAATTDDQARTSDAASQTIADVAALVQQTSAEATHVSESFKDLLTSAQALQAEVARFKVQ